MHFTATTHNASSQKDAKYASARTALEDDSRQAKMFFGRVAPAILGESVTMPSGPLSMKKRSHRPRKRSFEVPVYVNNYVR